MYYSYVEIEYVATSFSPARTDLADKLLTSSSYGTITLGSSLAFIFCTLESPSSLAKVAGKNGAFVLCRFLISFYSISIQHHHWLINNVHLLFAGAGGTICTHRWNSIIGGKEPSEKMGRKVVRNISLKGFLLMPSLLGPGGDGLREQSLREDVMILP
jgi:hypothetical protein